MKKDTQAEDGAREVAELTKVGEQIALTAVANASERMAFMLAKLKTKEGKIIALKSHAIHMGVATQFMDTIAPMADGMIDELKALDGNTSDSEARVLRALWLAKVLMEIQKGLENYEP